MRPALTPPGSHPDSAAVAAAYLSEIRIHSPNELVEDVIIALAGVLVHHTALLQQVRFNERSSDARTEHCSKSTYKHTNEAKHHSTPN